jgi:hypothetical protein
MRHCTGRPIAVIVSPSFGEAGYLRYSPKSETTESNRLTPQEIAELQAHVHRRGAEMRAILAARKQQAHAE